jgi:hypothetical protein
MNMKALIYFLALIVMAASALAAAMPYPLYGYTNPGAQVSAAGKTTTSDSSGYYQLELDSNVQGATFVVGGCSNSLNLPSGAGFRYDFTCPGVPIAPIVGGAAATAALIAALVIGLNRMTVSNLRKKAKALGIKGYSSMKKAQLVQAIAAAEAK